MGTAFLLVLPMLYLLLMSVFSCLFIQKKQIIDYAKPVSHCWSTKALPSLKTGPCLFFISWDDALFSLVVFYFDNPVSHKKDP